MKQLISDAKELDRYELIGANASPYSRKLLAVLRYRRLPYTWRVQDPATLPSDVAGQLRLMPMLRMSDGKRFECDSTPLAHMLEARHPKVRSIIPDDPAAAFLCHLIEDYADEWCTKMMYYFRWSDAEAARICARWVIRDLRPELHGAELAAAQSAFFQRQRDRREMVGCAPENGPLIEAHFGELLRTLNLLGGPDRYLFGTRPSLADFALYGQLFQLTLDSWPQAVVRRDAPLVENWVCRLDDASGVDGEWDALDGGASYAARMATLRMIGRGYLPFLVKNAVAITAGEQTVELEIDHHLYSQPAFKYQAKCFDQIAQHWSVLAESDRSRLSPLLSETGCLPYLKGDWREKAIAKTIPDRHSVSRASVIANEAQNTVREDRQEQKS
ncbi:MAG: glutathione S-transferase [Hyphomicrobiales bacterium]|nr:glutathione S-transferase [Hyphomicrobiales bacterium]MBV9115533.1 glutathione S-transferase [Hyphomicrobiales bacterium]MBV9516739.1 glutathione S-transferase [Hyphomicrobiales bacterium]